MVEYEKLIRQIVDRRPDLDEGEVKGHIQRLVESTGHRNYQWAESCLARALKGEPMPWEARPDWLNLNP